MAVVTKVELVPGFLQITDDFGRKSQIKIADVLRAVDIPDLNIDSLTLLTRLARLVHIITQTLLEQGTLSESMVEGYDWEYVKEELVDNMAADIY